MILTNKRTSYEVNNSNETAKLNGSIFLVEDNRIESFNGVFTQLSDDDSPEANLGNFNYSENSSSNTLSKSIHGVSFLNEENVLSLLNDTIIKIKTEVSTDILSE